MRHGMVLLHGHGMTDNKHHTWTTSEDLSHMERLGQEPLDFPCTRHCQLVLFRQLVHTQNGNDILQVLVVLQAVTNMRLHLLCQT